jgi:hypothetical protein
MTEDHTKSDEESETKEDQPKKSKPVGIPVKAKLQKLLKHKMENFLP